MTNFDLQIFQVTTQEVLLTFNLQFLPMNVGPAHKLATVPGGDLFLYHLSSGVLLDDKINLAPKQTTDTSTYFILL